MGFKYDKRGSAKRAMDDELICSVQSSALAVVGDEHVQKTHPRRSNDDDEGGRRQTVPGDSSVGVAGCANACKQALIQSRELRCLPSYPTYRCIKDRPSCEAKWFETGIDAAPLLPTVFFSADFPHSVRTILCMSLVLSSRITARCTVYHTCSKKWLDSAVLPSASLRSQVLVPAAPRNHMPVSFRRAMSFAWPWKI
ncbi:hypothetical protein PENSPDRAFT_282815 [Peniophora sp. CONT]|nr:hypothetical protein PENSPDRAFT_282815 [Peniophora sp. CONT]